VRSPNTERNAKNATHPFASFCQKVLIALYENDTPFEQCIVDFSDETSAGEFKRLWPIGKMPVLRDDARDRTVPESTTIIEYLVEHYPGDCALVPGAADAARETRFKDRFLDLYVHEPMQKIVLDRIRHPGNSDPFGVQQAKTTLITAYGMIDTDMAAKAGAMGGDFSMADCAAAPALFYANWVLPFGDSHKNVAAYFERLMERPSFARVVKEAEPYAHLFPT
jgi:glutathione S-transferase